jgi:hypothetical protein
MRYPLICALLLATLLPAHAQKPAPPAGEQSLAEPLEELLAGKRALDAVGLEVQWTENGKTSSVTIHGDGLGIHWQGKQFWLSAEQRLDLLRKLKAAEFLSMPPLLGGLPKGAEPPRKLDPERGYGRISLRIGKGAKVVEHDNEGPVNEQFVTLAKDLLATAIKHSASGVGVDSLADGLQKVLDDKIDVRAVKIEVGHMRKLACNTLEIEGLAAKVRGTNDVGAPFRGERSLRAEGLAAFIKMLQGEKFHELPENVKVKYDYYMHLGITVRILDKEHRTRGSGFDPELSPEEQSRRFEAVWRASRALQPPPIYEKKQR